MPIQSTPKPLRVAILGCGFMGTALVQGIIDRLDDTCQYDLKFSVSARSSDSIDRLQRKFESHKDRVDIITSDNTYAARNADLVILAFQPQQLATIMDSDGPLVQALEGKLLVSILAGVSSSQVAQAVIISPTTQHRVSRAIPSIGAQISESMTLIADTPLSGPDRDLVSWLFRRVGPIQMVPEDLINTATAVSAACHALTVVAVDAIMDGSVAEGIARPVAQNIAAQCLRSASTLLRDQMTIESLKESMSIARGITINALLQLDRGQVRAGISDAVRFAAQYSKGMSEEK
ncbi:pyrroline-5-carboxylate reductase [Fonsecaea monophora]|uniref:Pyrroline-5-carboxylate reductase n=1 Tax=Fonsecaea monophora TaxID=254056 RepID=A0A177FB48_9EURO|nr:pyrroline-5-carboxylate reductase [Fonsecaea monophora]KAH0841342.1 Pyrroline-5-carboxylate reductase [Fonsecaea pedrosoi]OAG40860.1 pyrroline-5-carboxylate reductase [Fonsecaea monophora]